MDRRRASAEPGTRGFELREAIAEKAAALAWIIIIRTIGSRVTLLFPLP